jgi:tRNA threonylcarbamoyladenosine biosynthesis protein TsaE
VYHFDFYRIRQESEAYEIGTEEYFTSGYPCFVEWPEKIPSLLEGLGLYGEVRIAMENEQERTITILIHDGEEKDRL